MTDRKMSGKQPVSGEFDLDRFVGGASQPEGEPTGASAAEMRISSRQHTGRNRREPPKKDLLSERVQLKITGAELATLKEKAGMVPISAFLRKFLKDGGLI